MTAVTRDPPSLSNGTTGFAPKRRLLPILLQRRDTSGLVQPGLCRRGWRTQWPRTTRGAVAATPSLGVLVDAAAAQAATQAEEPTTQAVAPTTQAACDHAPADKAVDAPADEAVVASADKSGEPPPADEGEDAKTSASQTAPNSQAAPMAQAAGDGAPAERIDAPAPPQGR